MKSCEEYFEYLYLTFFQLTGMLIPLSVHDIDVLFWGYSPES